MTATKTDKNHDAEGAKIVRQDQAQQQTTEAVPEKTMSINEPDGTVIGTPGGPPPIDVIDPPELLDIDPDFATIGDADLTLTCTGEGFDETCKIVFNGGEETTVFVSDTVVTTIVKPSTATTAGSYPVLVRNAAGDSEPWDFEFLDPVQAMAAKARPKKPAKAPKKKRR